jgi:hypothetical protein
VLSSYSFSKESRNIEYLYAKVTIIKTSNRAENYV